jgi:hypothetical protein
MMSFNDYANHVRTTKVPGGINREKYAVSLLARFNRPLNEIAEEEWCASHNVNTSDFFYDFDLEDFLTWIEVKWDDFPIEWTDYLKGWAERLLSTDE